MDRYTLATICILPVFVACESKDWESAGYQDGFAATVNTACKFRTTLVHGDFDNPEYAKGYSRGAQAGSAAVANKGCDALK